MKNNNPRKDILVLLIWYVAVYLSYCFIITNSPGIPYSPIEHTARPNNTPFIPYSPSEQTGAFSLFSVCYSGVLANDWLQNNLLNSLWYLHARPPLPCLYWGLLLKMSPSYCVLIWYIMQFLFGAVAVCLLYVTMARLKISRIPNMIACLAMVTLPEFFVYQVPLGTTHIELCLFAAVLYFISGFYVQPDKRSSLIGLFCTFATLALVRSQWHLFVLLSVGVLIALMENPALRKRIAILSLIFLIPVSAWYTKNQMLFGVWGASSWMGSNIAQAALRVCIRYLPLSEIKEIRNSKRVAKDFPAMFAIPSVIKRIPPETIPSYASPCLTPFFPGHEGDLAYFNFNYIGMIDSSLLDLHDSKVIIKKHPFLYVRGSIERAWEVSWSPSVSYDGQLGIRLNELMRYMTFLFCLLIPIMAICAVLFFRQEFDPVTRKFVIVTFYFALAMLFISCACNGSEQERMRWGQAPVYFIYAAFVMDVVAKKIKRISS